MKRWKCKSKEALNRMMDVMEGIKYHNKEMYLERLEKDNKLLFYVGIVFEMITVDARETNNA